MYQRTRAEWSKHLDFLCIDLLCLQLAYILAYNIRFAYAFGFGLPYQRETYLSLALVLALAQILSTLVLNSYGSVLRRRFFEEGVNLFLVSFLMLAVVILYLYSAHTAAVYSRVLVYLTIVLYAAFALLARTGWKKIAVKRHMAGRFDAKSLVVLTCTEFATDVVDSIRKDTTSPYRIQGLILSDPVHPDSISGVDVVAELDRAADYICREWVDGLFVYLPGNSPAVEALTAECAEMGITVHTAISLKNVNRSKQFIEEMGSGTVLTTAYNYISPYQAFIKRLADILGGLVGCALTVLIGLVIGPIIYKNSPGPILFKQKRIGRNGKVFQVLKFRSMYLDAEERKKEFLDQNRNADGMMFKMDFDPRIIGNEILPDGTRKTGIGEWIRKTSLDEFPQFFNVLRGDMSLVGTRPPTLDEWENYQYHHRARLAIKPGITGMWQVSGRSEITDFEEVVKLDTEYICNFRLELDLRILLKTILVVFKGKGAM